METTENPSNTRSALWAHIVKCLTESTDDLSRNFEHILSLADDMLYEYDKRFKE